MLKQRYYIETINMLNIVYDGPANDVQVSGEFYRFPLHTESEISNTFSTPAESFYRLIHKSKIIAIDEWEE